MSTHDIIPPEKLLAAYAQGVFPMAEDGEILWFSPQNRGLIPLDERFHIPKNLRKTLRRKPFEIRRNGDFRQVVSACSQRTETWIDDTILESYANLHALGFAHSIETWQNDQLVGGLYGVSLGRAFFGESMFSKVTDASKVALVALVDWLRAQQFTLLDTQWMTQHLRQFGGFEVPRPVYLELLHEAIADLYLGET